MSNGGPRLRSGTIWAKRERMCIAILKHALHLLRTEDSLPESEIDLNRRLYFCLLTASSELYPSDPIPPISECNNQPDANDMARAARELKRPDFQWVYRDQYESDPHRSCKQFVVECKRLGEAARTDWVFNLNYVNDGIGRFRDRNWAYGQRFPSGAMVGYWQSMDAIRLLGEINDEARRNSLPDLTLIGDWNLRDVSRLEHVFDRPFEVSPFELRHFWIDLRGEGSSSTGNSV